MKKEEILRGAVSRFRESYLCSESILKTFAEDYEKCLAKSLQFYRKFEEFGIVFCRDLTRCDLTTAEGRQKFKEQKVKEKRCTKYGKAP